MAHLTLMRSCALVLLILVSNGVHATYTSGIDLVMQVPPVGVVDLPNGGSSTPPADITGQVTGLPGGPALYKGIIMFYGQCGIWWDKGHNIYAGLPDRATAQNAGVPLDAQGRFTLPGWGYKTSDYDVLSTVIAVFIVPQSKDLSWPAFIDEDNPIHDDVWADAVAWLFVDRSRCSTQDLPCDEAHGAYTYIAKQPAFPQVFQYPAGTCPGPYPAAGPGEEIIPGGPVAPALPSPLATSSPLPASNSSSASATASASLSALTTGSPSVSLSAQHIRGDGNATNSSSSQSSSATVATYGDLTYIIVMAAALAALLSGLN